MTQQTINVGSSADDHTGDSNRTCWQKVNANFTELYAAGGGNVSNSGTPVANDVAQWVTSTTIKGVPLATWRTNADFINIATVKHVAGGDGVGLRGLSGQAWVYGTGTTADISLVLSSKGNGAITFYNGDFTRICAQFTSAPTTDTFATFTGSLGSSTLANNPTTNPIIFGSDTNIGIGPPQGRLTLQTDTPVMITTQAAKTTLYYTPYVGNKLPVYDGVNTVMKTFTELSAVTTDTTKSPAAIGASKVNDWFAWNDAGTLRLSHGPDWTNDITRSAGTALTRVNGIWLNNAAITNGPAASRGTYVGTTRSNASSQLDWIIGGSASGGVAGVLGVWNCYNRRSIIPATIDSGSNYTYSPAAVRQARASAGNQVSFVLGLAEDTVTAFYQTTMTMVAVSGASAFVGIGVDSITAYGGPHAFGYSPFAGTNFATIATCMYPQTFLGYHFISALEASDSTSGNTFNRNSNNILQVFLVM